MNLIPFFIDLTFEGEECRCPTCPVKTIHLGYKGPSGLVKYDYDATEEGWALASEWVCSFKKNGFIVPVGWDLRPVVWPAFTMNLARAQRPLPHGFLMPLEKRWNDLQMVDLSSVVVQSGYSDWKPSLEEVHGFFFGARTEGRSRIEMLEDLFDRYSGMIQNAR